MRKRASEDATDRKRFRPDQEDHPELLTRSCCSECRPGMCRLTIVPPQVERRNSVAGPREHLSFGSGSEMGDEGLDQLTAGAAEGGGAGCVGFDEIRIEIVLAD